MASSFLEQKAKKQAEKLEKQYGSSAYGGTTWLNNQLSGKKKKKKEEDEDDIAPVLSTSKKDKDDGFDFFQKGAFEDGYQFGDISKAILGTVGDVGLGVVKGASKLGEGIVDAGKYGLAWGVDALGNEKNADVLRKSAQKNSVDDFFAPMAEDLDKVSMLGRTGDALSEGLGQVGGIILTGGLGAAGGLGAIGTTALTSGVMGVSSMGSGMNEAYMGGATDEEAAVYGIVKGAVDAGSEMLFGGLGKAVKAVGLSKGLSSLDDVFARKLASKITNHTAKNFVEYGVKASAEGVEEVLAGIGSAVGKKLTYMDEKELSALVADENLLEQFVVGAVTSGIAQSGIVPGMKSGSLKESIQTGRDFISGNTVNEQKVIDKEYKNRINEQEQDGRKLSEKEKSKIYDAVVSDMEKGYISTDTIEEVLGGDTYKSYKDTIDSEDALSAEYEELGNLKDPTLAQRTRYQELHEQMKTKDDTQRNQLKSRLSEEVMGLVQNDRLAESYNERTRKGQAFEADLTRYDEKQKAVIQKAVESGILNNTNRTHEFVDMIAKISADKGVLFDFTNNERLKESGFAVEGKTVNGFVNENGVSLNIDSAKSLNSVVGHEITHVLEGTELYDVLQKTIVDYAKSKGDYQGRYDSLSQLYKDIEGANLDAELTADLVGDYLFTDSDFIHNLSTNHRNVFQKIYDEVKYLCKVATAGSKEARELEKVKRAFEKAYQSERKSQGDANTKYSMSNSEGVKLSEGQQEYFKDSKVRDENGNLKVMYHGTPNGEFTVFKDGTYFTDNKEYADRYQNPSASSISSGKVASNPKTFEVYLDIKKPFDITDAEARNIYINDYIKGGNALGINPYLSDAEYDKISTIDWTEGEDLRDFLIENDYDYDGLVLDEGGVGGYGDAVEYRGKSYVVFSPEQVKDVANENPTGDKDIRFSLSESVEETKDLMALHNLTEQKLLKSLKLGGLPMPSVAIAKAQDGHSEFGEISLILPKDTIDPEYSRKNKLYSGDAWTPTYPRVEYKVDDKVRRKISDKIKALVPYETQDALGGLHLDADNMNDTLNRNDGDMVDAFKRDDVMKYAYLKDTGSDISLPMKEADLYLYGGASNAAVRYFSGKLVNGLQTVELYQNMGARALMQDDALKEAIADAQNFDVLRTLEPGSAEYIEYEQNPVFRADEVPFHDIDNFLSAARKLFKNGVQQTVDKKAARELIRERVNQAEYEAWLDDLFSGIVEKEGIRNNKDYFTPSGNRRSFEALHYEHNLENVIKAMRETGEKGIGFGGGNIFGAATTEFSSVDEMKQSRDRLQKMSDEEYQAMREGFTNRFFEIAHSLPNDKRSFVATDDAATTLTEAVSKYKTRSGIANYLKRELKGWATYSDTAVDDLIELVRDIRNMPTGYFEAKPQRAVGFDEVGVFVIPNNTDTKLKQELLNRGYSIAEYDPNVEGDRQRVVNGFEEYKFNLSDAAANRRTFGNYNVYGKDVALAPITEDSSTVAENATVSEMENIAPMFPDDLAPMREPIPGQLDSLMDEDAPPEMDAPYYGEEEDSGETAVKDPMIDRDMKEVGNPKVNAYMYENPEVKPFFQQEAAIMLRELQDSTKGQKIYSDVEYMNEYGYVSQGLWQGQKRNTSDEIVYLLDGAWNDKGKGYTYAEIEKGLKAIIEDNGKENNACSKRIEFLLNDRLRDGYTDFRDGSEIPPDEGYLALLEEKQITEYSKEAFDALVERGEEYAPPVQYDIDPNDPAPTPEMLLPNENEVGGTTSRGAKGQQKLFPDAEQSKPPVQQRMWEEKTARILTEEPPKNKNQRGLWSMFKEYVLDNGMVFEDLSLKTGNRELQAKWHYIRNAQAMAQSFMGKGKNGVRALNDIRQTVENSGKVESFSEYVYHLLNVDRMTLAQRYEGMENKPVFGEHVTAAQSAWKATQLEKANPQFKRWANELYAINTQLREMLVEGGVLSRETADLWAEMYPHYIPIRRAGYDGAAINVALDTNRTGVNAPIKKATGGNRDILPMFDTMGQRTLQTYRAIAKNRFGLELRKTLGTTISEDVAGLDSVMDSMDNEEGLLTKGDKNKAPTFTVFENGKRYTFEITDEMYESMKPTSDLLAYTNPVANAASNAFRGVLTEYNPVFMLTNAMKDVQDIIINSQHPARTYMSIPKAINQMMRDGNYYREYMENGGEENTYFDGQENSFDTQEKGAKKLLGIPPLSWISKANNVIERLPRMAEYIASREDGRSIEVSMLDAARVTTNFAAGGKVTKALNRNGATFLNASVQGAVQQARNIREAKANGLKGAIGLAAKVAVAGLPVMIFNHLMWDDDEEYEELSDYVKQNYYIVGKYGDGKFVRIPKGRTLAVIQDAFEQMKNLATGDDEADLRSFLELAIANLAPNNPVEDNIIAPIMQVKNNRTWYGEDLIPTRLQDLPKAEQYDESTDAISKWLGEKQPFLSPYQLNYLLNQYSGGVGDVALPFLTPEAERGKNSLFAPLADKFTTDSVMNNQNVSDFYDTKDELAVNANGSKATDDDILMSKYMNAINSELSDLYKQKREIQNNIIPAGAEYDDIRDMYNGKKIPDGVKYSLAHDVQSQIVELTRQALDAYDNIERDGDYAKIGDMYFEWYKPEKGEPYWRKLTDAQKTKYLVTSAAGSASYATDGNVHYRREDDGSWTKISDRQLERQNEVTKALGITPEEYWSETDISFMPMSDGEYEYAFDNPANYALAKSVGGYDAYKGYSKDLSAIHADKDKNGKSISGSRKEKVRDYINNLDADYYTKIILWKNEYNSDDTYNREIIEYLTDNDDISGEEMREILLKLGFKVDSKGNISW